MKKITSLQNARVKAAAKLRARRGREAQKRIVIDGAREILRAIEGGVEVVELFVCAEMCQSPDSQNVHTELANTSADVIEVTSDVLEKLAFGERSEGVVAIAQSPQRRLRDIHLKDDSLIAIIERVEKPGNLGAILRTADAADVSAVIAADPICDLYNPNAIRASLGAIFTVRTVAATTEETLAWLRANELSIYAARVEGSVPYTDMDYRKSVAIVLGSEARGLTDKWDGNDITSISLPMLGHVDSLNVSATAAVLFYEARRQRAVRSSLD